MGARAVLVTGGASGIGLATARRFANAGDRVLIADIDGERAAARAAELGSEHAAVRADMGAPAEVVAMVRTCVERFGGLDVLVNNAGRIDSGGTSVVDQATEAFRALIAVNLDGAYLAATEAARAMAGRGGAIVNVASGAALRAIPLRNGYSASKAGLAAVTRTLACRLAGNGIRVNAIAPGYTRTELVETLIRNGRVDPEKVARRIPLGRMGTPDEMAEAIFHLASPAAAGVRGAMLLVDGASLAYGGSEDAAVVRGAPPRPAPAGRPVIAVAGAGSAIGAACARRLGPEAALILLDGDPAALEGIGVGTDALRVPVDLADGDAVATAIAEAAGRLGRLDGLVCAADSDAILAGASDVDLPDALDRHLTATFHAARGAGRVMLAQGFGAVVAVTSILGQAAVPGHDAAAAASAAVGMFTATLACEWGGSGIRVNTLAAGPSAGVDPGLLRRMPAGRATTPDEVAATAAFLLSRAASYISGTVVPVDGGFAIYSGPDL